MQEASGPINSLCPKTERFDADRRLPDARRHGQEGILSWKRRGGEFRKQGSIVFEAIFFLFLFGYIAGPRFSFQTNSAQQRTSFDQAKNPKKPLHLSPLPVKEEAQFPAAGGPPESLLARVGAIVVDGEDRLYIADNKDQRIKSYDPSGRFIKAFGKAGQGPGEYQDLSWIFLTSRGILGVHDFQRQNIYYYTLDGRYQTSRPVSRKPNTGGGRSLQIDGGDNFYSLTQVYDPQSATSWHEAARLGKDLASDDILERLMFPTGRDWKDKIQRLILRAHPAGGVIVGHPWEYLFRFYDAAGKLSKVVSREFDPILATQKELEYRLRLNGSRRKFNDPISDFIVDERGWLIIKTSRRTPDRKEQFFDVFDERGRYLAFLTLPTRDYIGDAWALVEPFKVHKGRIYIVGEDDENNLVIRTYAVAWPQDEI